MKDEETITYYAAFIHTISVNGNYFSFIGEYSTEVQAKQAVIEELKLQRGKNKLDSYQFCGKVEMRYCLKGVL